MQLVAEVAALLTLDHPHIVKVVWPTQTERACIRQSVAALGNRVRILAPEVPYYVYIRRNSPLSRFAV